MYNALSESWCTNVLDKCIYVILSKALLCHLIMFNTCYTEETCLWLACFASLLLISIFPHRRLFFHIWKINFSVSISLDKIKKKSNSFEQKLKKNYIYIKKILNSWRKFIIELNVVDVIIRTAIVWAKLVLPAERGRYLTMWVLMTRICHYIFYILAFSYLY